MLRKRVWVSILILLVALIGTTLFYGRTVSDRKPVPEESSSVKNKTVPVVPQDFVTPTIVSTNPLFAAGVPEHLQCPPRLIGVYLGDISPSDDRLLQEILEEIKAQWNPNRDLKVVWTPMIEAFKSYRTDFDACLLYTSDAADEEDSRRRG